MKRIKLKTAILASLLFIPMLFIGSGIHNTQINEKTLRDAPVDSEKYGTITHYGLGNDGTYGFSSHTDDGLDHLWMWGANEKGQLGLGNNNDDGHYKNLPIDITGGTDPVNSNIINKKLGKDQKITQLALGSISSAAVVETTKDDKTIDQLYMWGYNNHGQLGNGKHSENAEEDTPIDDITANIDQTFWDNKKITNLTLKGEESHAILQTTVENGVNFQKYKWGYQTNGDIIDSPKKDGKVIFMPTKNWLPITAHPPVPPIYVATNENMLAYIIMGSISGVILIVTIIVISIMYYLYRKEKTKKQLI